MNFNFEQERSLEINYQGVLSYIEAKQFLKGTPYTASKIAGAIRRFCNSSDVEKPSNFIEMEPFVNDLADFWMDANPEAHEDGEALLHRALSNYVAFSIVWKTKSKSSSIFDPTLTGQVGAMLILKNSLSQAVKIGCSYAKRNPALTKKVLSEGFVLGYTALLPIIRNQEKSKTEIPEDLTRLIGSYLAGNPDTITLAESLHQIEHKDKTE